MAHHLVKEIIENHNVKALMMRKWDCHIERRLADEIPTIKNGSNEQQKY
jgi:hypothetical protein